MKNRAVPPSRVTFALDSTRTLRLGALAAGAWLCAAAHADVTVQQKTNLDVSSVIKMHGSTTSSISGEKKRDDADSHCEGVMSLFCGNVRNGDIVRLDRGLTWHLEPDKKSYREDLFATPEEIAAMRARAQANLEKMRSCPTTQRQEPIDRSKCQMSPAKIDVHKTDDKLSIAGHDAQRTSATLTQSCTDKDTGDVCETVIAFDLWLTQDSVAGASDRRAFEQAYAKKLGLDDPQGAMRIEVAKFLAAYQPQIKELTEKSGQFKGQPLKTQLRVLMGGAQCSAVTKMKAGDSSSGGASSTNPMNDVAQAGKALGSMVGNLFHKKKGDDQAASAVSTDTPPSAAPTAAAAPASPDPYSQYLQLAAFTSETASINTDPVPADRFEVPPDWKKAPPRQPGKSDDDFTCPKGGG